MKKIGILINKKTLNIKKLKEIDKLFSLLECNKCNHEWKYKGKSKFYVTCPECYNKINIKRLVKGGN
jgi:ribosomal protein S27E